MKNHHAVRYLMLRYLAKYKNIVSNDLFKEVTRSITVVDDSVAGFYRVTWMHRAQEKKIDIARDSIKLYEKGDFLESTGAEGGKERTTHSFIDQWARNALEIPQISNDNDFTKPILSYFDFSESIIVALFILLVSRHLWTVSLSIVVIAIVETLVPRMRNKLFPVLLITSTVSPLLATGSIWFYSLLNIIDPKSVGRVMWASFALIMGLIPIFYNDLHNYVNTPVSFSVTVLAIGFVTMVIRILHNRMDYSPRFSVVVMLMLLSIETGKYIWVFVLVGSLVFSLLRPFLKLYLPSQVNRQSAYLSH